MALHLHIPATVKPSTVKPSLVSLPVPSVSLLSFRATACVAIGDVSTSTNKLSTSPVNVANLSTLAQSGLVAIDRIANSFLSYVSRHPWAGNFLWAKLEFSFLQNGASYDVRIMDDGFRAGVTIYKDGQETRRYLVGEEG